MIDLVSTALIALIAASPIAATHRPPDWRPVANTPAMNADSMTAFVDVSVVPMDREHTLSRQTVLVKGGKIVTIGPVRQVRVPSGARKIDGRGKFLLPGLADMHAHFTAAVHIATIGSWLGLEAVNVPVADSTATLARLFLWLANGVTTLRNMDFFDPELGRRALQLRERATSGREWIPHIYTAGEWGPRHYIGVPEGGEPPVVLDSIASYLASYKAAGYDFVKVHNESPEVLDSVLNIARRIGLPVAGHVPPPVRIEHILPLGYMSIEHPLSDYLWDYRKSVPSTDTTNVGVMAAAMRTAHVWHCPTQQHYDRLHPVEVATLKVEQDSGVQLLLGTDEVPWLGVITRELQSMVNAGLTPYQALVTGTRNVAVYFGTDDVSGTLAAGKQADMILLSGNPLQDVRYTAHPVGVMLAGRWLSRDDIDRQVARLQLPTLEYDGLLGKLEPNASVKHYWHNVADEFNAEAIQLFRAVPLTDTQTVRLRQLRTTYHAQLLALGDSLGASNQYTASTQRLLALVAHQLAEFRRELDSQQRSAFDALATAWMHKYGAVGYSVAIAGIVEQGRTQSHDVPSGPN